MAEKPNRRDAENNGEKPNNKIFSFRGLRHLKLRYVLSGKSLRPLRLCDQVLFSAACIADQILYRFSG